MPLARIVATVPSGRIAAWIESDCFDNKHDCLFLFETTKDLGNAGSADTQVASESGSAFDDSVVEQRLVESGSGERIVFSPGRLRRLEIRSEVAPGEQMDVSLLAGSRYQTKTYLDERVVCRVVVSGSSFFGYETGRQSS